MNAKEYLNQVYRIDNRINSLILEFDDLRSRADSLGGSSFGEKVQSSQKNDAGFVNSVLKIIELEGYITTQIDKLIDLKKEISASIENVSNVEEKVLLRYRYINCLTWEAIAEQMGYSLRQIYRIHGNALQHFVVPV